MPVEPPELEDFEAALGTDRHCQRPDTYSRVSVMGAIGKAGAGGSVYLRPPGSVLTCCVNWIGLPPMSLLLPPSGSLTLYLGGIYCGLFQFVRRDLEGEPEALVLQGLLTVFLPNCLCSHPQHLARKKSPIWRSLLQGVSPLSGPSPLRGLGLPWTCPSNPHSP